MKDAASLLQLSEMKGLQCISARDGFGFANDQIHAAIDRDQARADDDGMSQAGA